MTRARDVANIDGILTTKGDIYAATAASTPARLGVGSNGDTIVADSSTSTGLRYQSAYNGNVAINGGMDIWQRGTSFTASGYTADRFSFNNFTIGDRTVSRQSPGSTLPQFQYCARIARNSGSTNTTNTAFGQALETTDSLRFAGQAATLSFYARAGANYSGASSQIGALVISGTGTDQNRISGGYTGEAFPLNQNVTLTTSWQRFTVTGTIASTATELSIYFQGTSSGTAGANDWYEVTGVQLELGSVATTFKRAGSGGGTIQGELAACQRYYQRVSGQSAAATDLCTGYLSSTTRACGVYVFPVLMRVAPTIGISAAADIQVTWSAGTSATSSYNTDRVSPNSILLALTTSGLTTGQGGNIFIASGTTKYLEASAEL
jgi:hypothetical protein